MTALTATAALLVSAAWLGDPAMAAPATPTKASSTAPALEGLVREAAQPSVEAPTPGLVTLLSPENGSFLAGGEVKVIIRTSRVAGRPTVKLDEGSIDSRLIHRGNLWMATLTKVPAGVNHIQVRVRAGKKFGHASARVVVGGRGTDLLAPLTRAPRVLSSITDPGAQPFGFTAKARTEVMARLNDKPVELSHRRGNIYLPVLSTADGLRRGKNRIVILGYRENGQFEQLSRTFTIGNTPLAEAGRPQTNVPGRPLTLNASSSVASSRGSRLSYRWRLISKPVGATAPVIVAPNSARTGVRTSEPGHYVFAVTVTERMASGRQLRSTDQVLITTESPASALGIRFQTLAPNPDTGTGTGLIFGDNWYDWDRDFRKGATLGIYAFDPNTLTFPEDEDGNVIQPMALPPNNEFMLRGYENQDGIGDDTILVLLGRDGCCQGSHYPTGPFSRVFTRSADSSDGTFNKGRQLSDSTGVVLPAGSLAGYFRRQYSKSNTNGVATNGYTFVQDGNVQFNTSAASVANQGAADQAVYRLSDGGRALTAAGRSATGASPVTMTASDAALSQQWRLHNVYGSFYKLVNEDTGLCLDLNAGDGTTVQQYACDPNGRDQLNQLWAAVPVPRGGGSWFLKSGAVANDAAGRYLTRTADGKLAASTDSSLSNAAWNFDIPPALYTITDNRSGNVVAEPDYDRQTGEQVLVTTPTGALTERWQLVDKPGGTFALRNVASGLCLDVAGGSTADGTAVNRFTCDGTSTDQANQRWSTVSTSVGLQLAPFSSEQTGLYSQRLTNRAGKLVQQGVDDTRQPISTWTLTRADDVAPNSTNSYAIVNTARSSTPSTPTDATTPFEARHDVPGTAVSLAPIGIDNPHPRNLMWTLLPAADGQVMIRSKQTGQCIQTQNSPDADGTIVGTGTCPAAERSGHYGFTLTRQPDGQYQIVSGLDQVALSGDSGLSTMRKAAPNPTDPKQLWSFQARSTTFELDRREWTAAVAPGVAGVAVMAFDPAMRPVDGFPAVFATNGHGSTQAEVDALRDRLAQVSSVDGTTVFVQSIGHPAADNASWNSIATSIANLGGNPAAVLSLDGTGGYAMAGCGGCIKGQSYTENVRRLSSASVPVGARLQGKLGRDDESRLVPEAAGPVEVDYGLYDLATRPTTPWPWSPNDPLLSPAQREEAGKALDWVATQLGVTDTCGMADLDAVRSSYCPTGETTKDWTRLSTDLDKLNYPTGQGFDFATFDQVKAQLDREFPKVSDVHSMVGSLRGLYSVSSSATSATAIASQLEKVFDDSHARRKAPDHDSAGGWLDLAGEVWGLLWKVGPMFVVADEPDHDAVGVGEDSPAPELVERAFGVAAAIFDIAGENDDSAEGVSLKVRTTADDYAAKLQDNQQTLQINLVRAENLIVSDPLKLSITAANARLSWQLGADQLNRATTDLINGTTSDLWSVIMPTYAELWNWPAISPGHAITDITCLNGKVPSRNEYIYNENLSRRAIYIQPQSISPTNTRTKIITVIGSHDLAVSAGAGDELTIPDAVLQAFYAGIGYPYTDPNVFAQPEVLDSVQLPVVNYPNDFTYKGQQENGDCAQQNRVTDEITPFGQ